MKNKIVEIEFLVKAKNWQEVVAIFRDELKINKGKRNNSDRDIDGFFIVKVEIELAKLDDDFYKKVKASSKLAIISNPFDNSLRNAIMKEVYKAECHLKRLLLNVSDLVENYFEYFKKPYVQEFSSQKDLIIKSQIDPATSHLALEDLIVIFGTDLSWQNKTISPSQLLEILSIEDRQKATGLLKEKLRSNTVWDEISKNLLKTKCKWNEIDGDIKKLKTIRNKAAHFNVLTKNDLVLVKEVTKGILTKTQTKTNISQADLVQLRNAFAHNYKELFFALSEKMAKLGEVYQQQFAKSIEIANSYQFQQLIKTIENSKFFVSQLPPQQKGRDDKK